MEEPKIKRRSVWYSIFRNKCPRCREGSLFSRNSIFPLSKLTDTPQNCPVCGEDFVREPGFYWGAMYVSYGICVAWMLPAFALIKVPFGLSIFNTILILIALQILFLPWLFRLSRSLWIHIFVSYQPGKKGKEYHIR